MHDLEDELATAIPWLLCSRAVGALSQKPMPKSKVSSSSIPVIRSSERRCWPGLPDQDPPPQQTCPGRSATAAQTNARSGTHPITSPANRSDQKSREANECLWEKDVHSSSSIPTTGFYPFCCAMTPQTSRYISMISLVDI